MLSSHISLHFGFGSYAIIAWYNYHGNVSCKTFKSEKK